MLVHSRRDREARGPYLAPGSGAGVKEPRRSGGERKSASAGAAASSARCGFWPTSCARRPAPDNTREIDAFLAQTLPDGPVFIDRTPGGVRPRIGQHRSAPRIDRHRGPEAGSGGTASSACPGRRPPIRSGRLLVLVRPDGRPRHPRRPRRGVPAPRVRPAPAREGGEQRPAAHAGRPVDRRRPRVVPRRARPGALQLPSLPRERDMTRPLTYKNHPVPYIAAWSNDTCRRPHRHRRRRHRLRGRPRPRPGTPTAVTRPVLWSPRSALRQGDGKPEFNVVHAPRQKRAMRKLICQVCGGPSDVNEQGRLFLAGETTVAWRNWPQEEITDASAAVPHVRACGRSACTTYRTTSSPSAPAGSTSTVCTAMSTPAPRDFPGPGR